MAISATNSRPEVKTESRINSRTDNSQNELSNIFREAFSDISGDKGKVSGPGEISNAERSKQELKDTLLSTLNIQWGGFLVDTNA